MNKERREQMGRKRKALVTAIASVIAFILLVINTLTGLKIELSPETINAIATLAAVGIMWFIGNYYNQDYSKVAEKMTPIMRKIKILEKEGDLQLLDAIEHLIGTWESDDEDEEYEEEIEDEDGEDYDE